jgi:(2Fe-2S) ferredoxin
VSKDKLAQKSGQELEQRSTLSSLEGQVIQWLDRPQGKQLLLATSDGEIRVKLNKSLRHYLATTIDRKDQKNLLGAWVQVSGSYRKNGKYKAQKLLIHSSFNLSSQVSSPLATLDLPYSSLHSSIPALQSTQSKSTRSKPVKSAPACILVCGKSSCQRRGAGAVIASLQENISDRSLEAQVKIKTTGCLKNCKQGVNVVFLPDKTTYTQVKPIQVSSLVTKHFPHPATLAVSGHGIAIKNSPPILDRIIENLRSASPAL